MGNNCKYFSGSIPYERLAATIYDRFALQHFGLRAKVNLSYTRSQLKQLAEEIEEQIKEQISQSKSNDPHTEVSSCLHPSDMIIFRGNIPLAELADEI